MFPSQAISEQYDDNSYHCNPPIELSLRDSEESITVTCISQSVALTSRNQVWSQNLVLVM